MASAGVGVLVTGVSITMKKLSDMVVDEISLVWGVKKESQKLKKTLELIMAVLTDAEKKQVDSEPVRKWLEQLKDIAYEAEDIFDEHSYEVIRQREMARKRDRVSNFFSTSNSLLFRTKVAHEIKSINEKLKEHALAKTILGLKKLELGPKAGPMDLDESSRETDSSVESSKIVGRDNDKSNIINMLFHNDPQDQGENIQVIPIVGMGGLGKTTLAQLIYNDDIVERHFDLKMWVFVSDDFNVKKLLLKIIESITNGKCEDVSNIDVIVGQLRHHLNGRKYLLVLDDVWNKKQEQWERLRKQLSVGGYGSKIIVTTRSDDVASIMDGKPHSYKLEVLDEDESWSLFKKKAFGNVENPTLTRIGKELVEKCDGLPLAIIFLGSLLRHKTENEWRVINENNIWNQSFDENESGILPVLKLSYNHLPSHLKQCFSYFSLFPKNCIFNKEKLILLWMAEGFIVQPTGKNIMSMEEVGNGYFNSLLHNSFIIDGDKDVVGQILEFRIHDLVHDLANYVVGDYECLISLAAHEHKEIDPKVLRLGIEDYNEGMSKTVSKVLQNKPKLRTLIAVHSGGTLKKIEKNAFDGTNKLRVLQLSGMSSIERIPSSMMVNLKHLRYLCLSSTKIINLPKSVMRLFHLQTLQLKGCENLTELPKGIDKLINLRHLSLPYAINVPREIGQLSNLRTLSAFNVGRVTTRSGGRGEGGCGIEVLEGLNLLSGAMVINHLRNVTSGINAQRADLKGKKNLDRIFLSWHTYNSGAREDIDGGECNKDEVVVEALQPHPNLKWLIIDQYFGAKLPSWIGDPSCLPNLVVLQLIRCNNCEQLVGIGKLPSLERLSLLEMDGIKCLANEFYGCSCVGEATTPSVLFPSLKELVISDMVSLEEWVDIPPPTTPTVANYSCFPCLKKIAIYFCPKLRITPTHFPSLNELILVKINERVAVPIITTNLNNLFWVELVNISELRFLPHHLLEDYNLWNLQIHDCLDFQGFMFVSKELQQLQQQEEAQSSSIRSISLLRLPALKFLPDIRSFTSLMFLDIQDCESFKPLPEDLSCLSSSLEHLVSVEIKNVKEVQDFKWHK